MNKRRCGPPKFVFVFFALAALFVFGAIVMLLWNAILPEAINGVHKISYWQGVGLLVLSKILFSSFRGPGNKKNHMPYNNLREKFKNMSEEEKQQFKEEWKRRCGMRHF